MDGYKMDRTLLTSRDMQMILAGLRSLDSVSGSGYYGQLMEKLQAGSSEFISGRDKVHEKSVRRAAKRIDAGVGECIHDIMGDDFIKYLKTHYVLWHGTEFDSFWNTLQMVTLFRYSYGYGMNLDMTDVNLTGFLSKRFEALKDCHNIDQEISSAIEILEIMGDFQNGEQLTDKNNSEAMKDIMDVARCIVETRNDELLEASLRKKLLPICIYKELMEQARDKAPSLIPCLIAYRQAV